MILGGGGVVSCGLSKAFLRRSPVKGAEDSTLHERSLHSTRKREGVYSPP